MALAIAWASTPALAQAPSTAPGTVIAATPKTPTPETQNDHPRRAPADEGLRSQGPATRPDNSALASTDDNRETALLGTALTALVWLHRRNRKGPGQG